MHMDFFMLFLHMIFSRFLQFPPRNLGSFTCDLFSCARYMQVEQNECFESYKLNFKELGNNIMLPPFVILNNKQMDF